jgi:LmbE family N-acetylglucosaminyl deacetylase
MSRPAPWQSLLVVLALGVSATGCGKFREVSACRSLARDVNRAVDEIEALSKAKPLDEPRIAKRYATLAQTLQPRSLGEKPLAQAVRDYVSVLQATDTTLRTHATALKTQYGRVSEPRRELERLVKREHAATARIEVECAH